jgi:hypothetical protein
VDGGWRGGETGGGETAVGSRGHGKLVAAAVWSGRRGRSVVRTRRLTGGPSGFVIFLELSKPAQTWKLKMDTLCCSKNCQILHAARLGRYEQLS